MTDDILDKEAEEVEGAEPDMPILKKGAVLLDDDEPAVHDELVGAFLGDADLPEDEDGVALYAPLAADDDEDGGDYPFSADDDN